MAAESLTIGHDWPARLETLRIRICQIGAIEEIQITKKSSIVERLRVAIRLRFAIHRQRYRIEHA